MSFVTGTTNEALRPDDHGAAYFQNLQLQSVALQVTDPVFTESTVYRVPLVTANPTVGWFAEASAITATDPTTSEEAVIPKKAAALTHLSNEMINDSANQATLVVTQGMASDLAKTIDEALFGTAATNGPKGLQAVTGVNEIDLTADFTNVDAFLEAISDAQAVNEVVTSFVAAPATALRLAQLKEATGSNRGLLQPDATRPGLNVINGIPLYVSSAVEADVVWAIPRRSLVAVLRTPAEIAFSKDYQFNADMTSVRLVQRVGFGYPHPASISKITATVA